MQPGGRLHAGGRRHGEVTGRGHLRTQPIGDAREDFGEAIVGTVGVVDLVHQPVILLAHLQRSNVTGKHALGR